MWYYCRQEHERDRGGQRGDLPSVHRLHEGAAVRIRAISSIGLSRCARHKRGTFVWRSLLDDCFTFVGLANVDRATGRETDCRCYSSGQTAAQERPQVCMWSVHTVPSQGTVISLLFTGNTLVCETIDGARKLAYSGNVRHKVLYDDWVRYIVHTVGYRIGRHTVQHERHHLGRFFRFKGEG